MTEAIFDDIAKIYDDTRKLSPKIMSSAIEKLANAIGPDSTILDVGVGTGRFSIPLCEAGFQVTGIDLSSGMLKKCKEKGHSQIVKANACQMPFFENYFDNAFMTHVLHLAEDWKCLLREITRVTAANLISLISHWPEDDWPGAYYGKRVKELGYVSHPGIYEKDLADMFPPWERIKIGNYSRERKNDCFIQILEKRQYSSATKLPDDLHIQVVEEIREKYGGGVQMVEFEVEIVFWDIECLSKSLLNIV